MTTIHRPARLATRAASFRYGGRHHSGIPGGFIPLYPGGFVGIGSSLACTNIIENVMGTVRTVYRNVKYWRSPSMALRWAAAATQEAVKGFRR